MAVSFPRGAAPTSAPGMSPAVPAPIAPKKASKGSSALHHHGKIGAALKAGDHKTAMHHTGHMMLALRSAMKAAGPPALPSPATQIATDPMSEGTDEGFAGPPTKKPAFNRNAFSALKSRPTL